MNGDGGSASSNMWLVHKSGYSLCQPISSESSSLPEGRCQVKMVQGGEVLEVDENDLEKVRYDSRRLSSSVKRLFFL